MKIQELVSRNAFEVGLEEALSPDANDLGGRFVFALKNLETDRESYKTRFVV